MSNVAEEATHNAHTHAHIGESKLMCIFIYTYYHNVDTRLVKGTGIIESVFPYSGSHPLFKGTRIIESFFGQGDNSKKNSTKQN